MFKYIKVYSNKPDNFRQFVVRFVAERTTRFQPSNNGISAVVSDLFLFVLGSVFHEDKVSSLNKFEVS